MGGGRKGIHSLNPALFSELQQKGLLFPSRGYPQLPKTPNNPKTKVSTFHSQGVPWGLVFLGLHGVQPTGTYEITVPQRMMEGWMDGYLVDGWTDV